MHLEWHQLEMKYEGIRIVDPARQARLMASVEQMGQQSAVLVVDGEDGYVLIDGYGRVRALRLLGHDTVWAVQMPLTEVEALVLCHRLVNARRRTALEDGWLIRELLDVHGKSQREVARVLCRSWSWVSRRLALVKDLPMRVQEHVRSSKINAYAAMKYMVPLARANKGSCIRLAKQLGQARLSTRQVGKLYTAWRRADKEERQRIEENPLLYLKAIEQLDRSMAEDKKEKDDHSALLKDLEILIRICNRIRRAFTGHEEMGLFARGKILKKLNKKWQESCLAFENTKETMEELLDVGRGQT